MAQITSYFHHSTIFIRETFSEVFVKIRHDDVILRQLTSFSYIFLYCDIIDKNAAVSKKFADNACFYSISGKLNIVATFMQKNRAIALFVQILTWGGSFHRGANKSKKSLTLVKKNPQNPEKNPENPPKNPKNP